MLMKSFEEFRKWAADSIIANMPSEYSGAKVELHQVRKIGEAYTGLTVRKEGQANAATINLEQLYGIYLQGAGLDEIMSAMTRIAVMTAPLPDPEIFSDYSAVKPRLFVKLSSLDSISSIKDKLPHRMVEDMVLTYHILGGMNSRDMWSVTITGDLLRDLGVTEDQLHEDAVSNSQRLFPAKLDAMRNIVRRGADEDDLGMMVLTNDSNSYGASAVVYPGVIGMAAEEMGGDIYIIPSSVHEMILMPAGMVEDAEYLQMTHRYLNMTEVAEKDRLSDHIYHYDLKTRRLERAVMEHPDQTRK